MKRALGVVLSMALLAGVAYQSIPSTPLEQHSVPRSGKWPAVRAAYLKDHPACEVCGVKEGLEVHHERPFHTDPSLELDPTNFVVLCGHTTKANHHLWFGHLGDYKCSNPQVREWIKAVKERQEQ